MIRTEVRLDMEVIAAEAIASYMEHRGYTVRSLADAVSREVRKKNPHMSVTRSTIGHLRNPNSGRRTVKPEVGRAIEKVLGAPPNSLFIDKLSIVQRETRRGAA